MLAPVQPYPASFPSIDIPAQAGIQFVSFRTKGGKSKQAARCAEGYAFWIPAFAGMTRRDQSIVEWT
jgi:hypothetical protein